METNSSSPGMVRFQESRPLLSTEPQKNENSCSSQCAGAEFLDADTLITFSFSCPEDLIVGK
jgi:hypothetical protein